MFEKVLEKYKKKSLQGRFLLVLGILFFLLYLVLGLFIMFSKTLPIDMERPYRIAFGLLLIVYSFIRFVRLINQNE
nr:hypothetical protein [Flavobacterium agrisoli]